LRRVLHRHWTHDVVEIVGWNQLSKPHDDRVREQGLAPPEFVEFRAVERGRARQTVVAGHSAKLLIRSLAVESEHGDPERCAGNPRKFVEIRVAADHRQIVETRGPWILAPGGEGVSVADHHPAQPDAAVGAKTEELSQRSGPWLNVHRARIPGCPLRCVLSLCGCFTDQCGEGA